MNVWIVAQLVLAILLSGVILIQQQGTGLGASFGGEGNVYRSKRGLERGLFFLTILLALGLFGVIIAYFIFVK